MYGVVIGKGYIRKLFGVNMLNQDFVHLHVHSEYSLLDGLGSPAQYAERAAKLGFSSIAITDHGNIDGHLKWQRACKNAGVKPIFGCELYVVEDVAKKEKGDQKFHMIVLVKNFEGWKALARMLTVANLEGFYSKPRIDRKVLLDNVNDGLVILTGCSGSFLLMPNGVELLIELKKNRGVDCYLEVMPHGINGQVKVNELCLALNRKYDLPLVATNDCHYVLAEHAKAQEVLLAVQRQAKWKDKDRWKFGFEGLHLRTADEMIAEFKIQGVLNRIQYYNAMSNALAVGEMCWGFEIPKREISLPKVPGYPEDVDAFLIEKCLAQFKEIFGTDISEEFWNEFERREAADQK